MTRYIPAFSWTESIERFIHEVVIEKPLLNVCCGNNPMGDTRMDLYPDALQLKPDVVGDMNVLPFGNDTYSAVFANPPWDATAKKKCADFCKEAMRVAPVLYLMSPWIWGTSQAALDKVWVRQLPGINNAICLTRYVRKVA